jgi:hypothetical protein
MKRLFALLMIALALGTGWAKEAAPLAEDAILVDAAHLTLHPAAPRRVSAAQELYQATMLAEILLGARMQGHTQRRGLCDAAEVA